ncbi:TLC domain-containing protein 4-B-like [Callorhinchus milii]|uniref:TLC domain-containing protein 4-B-like n=1 Tax=Callorhinchus milii TaxID=7868 RepID=UPI001C3F8E38|nr:TLC domain-containing protein 4-B-like [Callorhinchus milii]
MEASYLLVAGSFSLFQVLFHIASPRLSASLSPGYKLLSEVQKTEWNSRCVSTLHALLVGSLSLYILWFDEAVNRDPVWGDPKLVKVNIAIASGYLINDLVLLLCHWTTIGDGFFLCHHLAALYAYQYVLNRGLLPYFANFRLIAELSTPFVNQRWFFEVLGFPRTKTLAMLNGVAMAGTFFLVRIAVIPSYYHKVVDTFGTEGFERLGLGPQCAWLTSSISLDVLNVIWMYKIGRGCCKILLRFRSRKPSRLLLAEKVQ